MSEKTELLEPTFKIVREKGIDPFLTAVESEKREFFEAKDFVGIYDLIFKLCIQRDPHNYSKEMYERYMQTITDYVKKRVAVALTEASYGSEYQFLHEWQRRWDHHKKIVKGLMKLFMYLDRFYVPNTDGCLTLKELGYKIYHDFAFVPFSAKAQAAILKSIDKERNAEAQDRMLVSKAVTVFTEMGMFYKDQKLTLYKNLLEKFVIDDASTYYKRRSMTWLNQDSCPAYMDHAQKLLDEEKDRVEAYLHRSTLEPLDSACYRELLQVHQKELLAKKTGLSFLLETDAKEDLSRMFGLYKRDPNDLAPLAATFQDHVRRYGSEIVDKAKASENKESKEAKKDDEKSGIEESNHSLVTQLIDLHAQFHRVVTGSFQSNQLFQKALKHAFEDFINKDDRVSKLLATYVNEVLTKGSKINVKEMEETLSNIVFIYGYIQNKDVFEKDYQNYLARRLLMGQCASETDEKNMIAKLKTECGYQWTNKLEGMFKDMSLSQDMMKEFYKVYTDENFEVQMDVNVCTTGYWPSTKDVPFSFPKDLATICDKYKRFYLNKYQGHKLSWRMDLGQAEVLVVFKAGVTTRTLVCSTYMMMVLLVFNDLKKATFKQIMDVTGVPKGFLSNHILSLAHPLCGVLLKKPNVKEIEEDHMFMINPSYKSQLQKVQIPLLRSAIVVDDTTAQIELQRQLQADAAIVRIMKSRKTLSHVTLVGEVMQQLQARFTASPVFIKKRIEALIAQEYLKRDENVFSTYNYLA